MFIALDTVCFAWAVRRAELNLVGTRLVSFRPSERRSNHRVTVYKDATPFNRGEVPTTTPTLSTIFLTSTP